MAEVFLVPLAGLAILTQWLIRIAFLSVIYVVDFIDNKLSKINFSEMWTYTYMYICERLCL